MYVNFWLVHKDAIEFKEELPLVPTVQVDISSLRLLSVSMSGLNRI